MTQTNPNKEDKNIVERWDWDDCHGIVPVRASTKLCWRRLRRKRQKRMLDKAIEESTNATLSENVALVNSGCK